MRILLASNNPKKRDELARILGDRARVVVPADLGIDLEPAEDGDTFAENARAKALAFAAACDLPCVADDSGLEVDALGGLPGVRSARFAGPDATDAENRALLLRELEGVPLERRTARFVCALCLALGDRILFEGVGACEGRILEREKGTLGFGYDPLFLYEPAGRTFAELEPAEKDAVSHRGKALTLLKRALPRSLEP